MKLFGLMLTIMLVVSLFVPAGSASAAYGNQQWQLQPMPSNSNNVLAAGSDLSGIAVGTGMMYAVDNSAATGIVYKSTDNGATWTKTSTAGAVTLLNVAMAPDNTSVLAVASKNNFYISTDSGSTWTLLGSVAAGATITSIAVSPARSGTLLGREYFMAVADDLTLTTALGDLMVVGGNSSVFTTIAAATGTGDFMAVACTPNYLGDRSVVALRVGAVAGAGNVDVRVFNVSTNTLSTTTSIASATLTTDFKVVAGAATVIHGTIALPSDYDASNNAGKKAYVGFKSGAGDNGVFRIDNTTYKDLASGNGPYSLAYAGTVSSGTLYDGWYESSNIQFASDPTSSSPTWTTNTKYYQPLGPGQNPSIIVAVAPDYSTSKTVYAVSQGNASAFSISTNGGIAFNQKSLIDIGGALTNIGTGMSTLSFAEPAYYFTAIDGYGYLSLWKGMLTPSDTGYSRVFCAAPLAGGNGLALNLINANTWTVMEQGPAVAGQSPIKNLWRTTDAGDSFNIRQPPTANFPLYTTGDAWADDNIGYYTDGATIYKTTNGAFTWGTGVSTGITGINQLQIVNADNILLIGTGAMVVSKDGGLTFTKYDLDTGISYRVQRDAGYATNNIIYLADRAAQSVWKYQIGTDTRPIIISGNGGTAAGATGFSVRAGVMYVVRNAIAPFNLAVDRSVNFTDTPGTATFDIMDSGAPAAAVSSYGGTSRTVDGNNTVFVRTANVGGAVPALYGYSDVVGSTTPKITGPANNYALAVNPNNGMANQFTINVASMGTGSGLANAFDYQITDNASGFDAPQISVANQIVSNPTSPAIVVAGNQLNANTSYLIRVRAANEVSGDAVHSKWSAPISINVQGGTIVNQTQIGPQLLSPQGGSNTSTTPGFSWTPQAGATAYKVVIATDAAMTKTVAGTPATVTSPAFGVTTPLTAGTYFWSVQASAPTAGPVSIGSFTVATSQPGTTGTATAAPPATITIPPIVIPTPTFVIPTQPVPTITVQANTGATTTPAYVWAIIVIGAILVIAVIVLIMRTRKI